MNTSKDRDLLKKKLKDMKAAIERERKQEEREQKARERLLRQAQQSASGGSAGAPVKRKKFFSK